eukprot:tig00020538_g10359.t1
MAYSASLEEERHSSRGMPQTSTLVSSGAELPDDLLRLVFRHLPHEASWPAVERVCRSWRGVASPLIDIDVAEERGMRSGSDGGRTRDDLDEVRLAPAGGAGGAARGLARLSLRLAGEGDEAGAAARLRQLACAVARHAPGLRDLRLLFGPGRVARLPDVPPHPRLLHLGAWVPAEQLLEMARGLPALRTFHGVCGLYDDLGPGWPGLDLLGTAGVRCRSLRVRGSDLRSSSEKPCAAWNRRSRASALLPRVLVPPCSDFGRAELGLDRCRLPFDWSEWPPGWLGGLQTCSVRGCDVGEVTALLHHLSGLDSLRSVDIEDLREPVVGLSDDEAVVGLLEALRALPEGVRMAVRGACTPAEEDPELGLGPSWGPGALEALDRAVGSDPRLSRAVRLTLGYAVP